MALELRGDGHGQDFGRHGDSQSHEAGAGVVMGLPCQSHTHGTLSVDSQTIPRGTSPVSGQTLTLDRHHGSIAGDGRTILSVGGHTSTLGCHSCPDPVGDQTMFNDGWTITLIPHCVQNLVMGQTVLSVCGRTPTLGRHFCPDPDEGQTSSSGRGRTPTPVCRGRSDPSGLSLDNLQNDCHASFQSHSFINSHPVQSHGFVYSHPSQSHGFVDRRASQSHVVEFLVDMSIKTQEGCQQMKDIFAPSVPPRQPPSKSSTTALEGICLQPPRRAQAQPTHKPPRRVGSY